MDHSIRRARIMVNLLACRFLVQVVADFLDCTAFGRAVSLTAAQQICAFFGLGNAASHSLVTQMRGWPNNACRTSYLTATVEHVLRRAAPASSGPDRCTNPAAQRGFDVVRKGLPGHFPSNYPSTRVPFLEYRALGAHHWVRWDLVARPTDLWGCKSPKSACNPPALAR